jgi:hypothetical protein
MNYSRSTKVNIQKKKTAPFGRTPSLTSLGLYIRRLASARDLRYRIGGLQARAITPLDMHPKNCAWLIAQLN